MASKTIVRLLCWFGYAEILRSFADDLAAIGLTVVVRECNDADEIRRRFLPGMEDYDVVIVDWEYRHRYAPFLLTLPDDLLERRGFLKPFEKPHYSEIDSRPVLLPLRFGTNGFVFRKDGAHASRTGFSLAAALNSVEPMGSIGVWKWWLPNVLLLARADGIRSLDLITDKELKHLGEGLLRAFVSKVRQSFTIKPGRRLFDSLGDIIAHSSDTSQARGVADWILGPSEMIVAPVVAHQAVSSPQSHTLDWGIPEEGGLIWLEAAAVSKAVASSDDKRDAAFRLLTFLQSDPVQAALMCGSLSIAQGARMSSLLRDPARQGHWSYVMNNTRGLDLIPPRIRSAFRNPSLQESAAAFGGWVGEQMESRKLVMRAMPDRSDRLLTLWREALAQCAA